MRSVTGRRGPAGEKWTTYRDAAKALRDALAQIDKGEWADPSKQPTGDYLDEWAAGLRLGASTMASYRKNIRLHHKPYLGAVPLRSLTTVRIDALYRQLEARGRRDHKGELTGEPLSPHTVRYVHTILSAALADAAEAGLLARNPASAAHPPTAKQARRRRCRSGPRRSWPRSWPGRRATATRMPRPGTCSPTPACGGVRRSRSAGGTWTWTRAP